MSNYIQHPYHLVDESPWPIFSSAGGFFMTSGLTYWFVFHSPKLLLWAGVFTSVVAFQWWYDVSIEATFQGSHSSVVELGMRWGMILFIVSEILFFVSFFWAFFHSSLVPSECLGGSWPPVGISVFDCFKVPLLNTLILLSSGASVTWSHHHLMENNNYGAMAGLFFTIVLGIYFTMVQALEYHESSFSISDGAYGCTFFVATGFHGLHVLVGTLFLMVVWIRMTKLSFNSYHHFGFEAAAWYWHFVDVVWLFLFVSIYWWGGN